MSTVLARSRTRLWAMYWWFLKCTAQKLKDVHPIIRVCRISSRSSRGLIGECLIRRKNQRREEGRNQSRSIHTRIHRMITCNYTGAIILRHVKNGGVVCRRCHATSCLPRRTKSIGAERSFLVFLRLSVSGDKQIDIHCRAVIHAILFRILTRRLALRKYLALTIRIFANSFPPVHGSWKFERSSESRHFRPCHPSTLLILFYVSCLRKKMKMIEVRERRGAK